MAFSHGKNVYVSVAAANLSTFCNSVEFKSAADSHDTTTFGQTGHTYAGGLTDGTISLKGTYDDGATSPQAILQPLLGTLVAVVYRPEGTGTGKNQDSCTALLTAYEESAPVADMITWGAEFQISGAVATVNQ